MRRRKKSIYLLRKNNLKAKQVFDVPTSPDIIQDIRRAAHI